MTLEEEIKSKFKNIHQKATVNLIYTSHKIINAQTGFFKKFGLTGQQFNVLRILRGQHPKPATVNLLIERMLDKSSNASRLVDKLVDKELVSRVQCKEDRRAVNVLITKKGLKLLEEIDNASENNLHPGVESLSNKEINLLNDLLDKIRSNF